MVAWCSVRDGRQGLIVSMRVLIGMIEMFYLLCALWWCLHNMINLLEIIDCPLEMGKVYDMQNISQ